MTKKKVKKLITNLLIFMLAAVSLFSAYKVLAALGEYAKGREEYEGIREQMIILPDKQEEGEGAWVSDGYLRFDFNGLMRVNPDFKCWIDIPGTVISYPVVQGPDNWYYLRKTFLGQV